MVKKKLLEKRIEELEMKNRLMTDALLQLGDLIDKNYSSFAMIALAVNLSKDEVSKVEGLIVWGMKNLSNITRNDFIKKFEEELPTRKGLVMPIIEAYNTEGLIKPLCDLMLR
jgi:hypothetical protein